MKINIMHLYPDLLNLYGDKGNVASLVKRLEWRGIESEVKEYTIEEKLDFSEVDIIVLGGGSDNESIQVAKTLQDYKIQLKEYADNGGVILAMCSGFQMLGSYFMVGDEKVQGLGVLDIYSEFDSNRILGDVVIQPEFSKLPIVGFENHGGRTHIGSYSPLGRVIRGTGNKEHDLVEGVIYKNTVGTYIHGPLLPKNPQLTDFLLNGAVKNKDENFELSMLDDSDEIDAISVIVDRYNN
ncbi:MAG: glutamine amidotransferase [Eubacteriales bacterium]|nr:glutamine amidotransferase [Eubacteriales bacterium]